MTDLPPLTYLSFDGVAAGVGASQVLPYVEAMARRGIDVTLHSFEPGPADPAVADRLRAAGATWVPHPFGRAGPVGGLGRVLRAARSLRGAELVHARSDLAAAAALLARAPRWVWDVRSFWADQRIEIGLLRAGSPEERALRWIEGRAARSADGVVTLAAAAVPVLEARHGAVLTARRAVVPTCVDLDRFPLAPPPPGRPVRLLLSGSINRYYDVPAMCRLVELLAERRPVELAVVTPDETPWDDLFAAAGAIRSRATPAEMPALVAASHVGLSVCRTDVGDSLRAAVPTKLGEFLASGRPVVVNAGLGDMDALLAEHRCGVVLGGGDDGALRGAVDELESLLDDPDLGDRCRRLAESHFGLDVGVDRLVELYRSIAGPEPRA